MQSRDLNEDKSPDRHRRRRRRGRSVPRVPVLQSRVFPKRLKIGVLFTPLQRNCGQQSFESRCLLSIAFSSRTDEHPRRKRKTGLQGRVLQAGSQSCGFDARTGPGNRRLRIDMTITDIGQFWRRSRPPVKFHPRELMHFQFRIILNKKVAQVPTPISLPTTRAPFSQNPHQAPTLQIANRVASASSSSL